MTTTTTTGVLQIQFSCKACGLDHCKLTVRARREGQRLEDWLDTIRPTLALHHRIRSPRCPSVKVDFHIPGVPHNEYPQTLGYALEDLTHYFTNP